VVKVMDYRLVIGIRLGLGQGLELELGSCSGLVLTV